MTRTRCEFARKLTCPNKPWRVIEVSWRGRLISQYQFCRKHYALVVKDGKNDDELAVSA